MKLESAIRKAFEVERDAESIIREVFERCFEILPLDVIHVINIATEVSSKYEKDARELAMSKINKLEMELTHS